MQYIGLLDCNNFFVSCERLFRPDLRTKPVVVLSSNDGCVVARSEEVKALGVPMGAPHFQIKDDLAKSKVAVFSGNLTLYRDISARVQSVLEREVGLVQPYSIDESFFMFDAVSSDEALLFLQHVKQVVDAEVGVPVSLGAGKSKTIAKYASEKQKRGSGTCVLVDETWHREQQIAPLAVVWGVGRQTSAKLTEAGLRTVADLVSADRALVERLFGVVGLRLQAELSEQSIHVVSAVKKEAQKSIMSTRSFRSTTERWDDIAGALTRHVSQVAEELRARNLCAGAARVMLGTSRHGDWFLRGGSADVLLAQPTADTSVLLKEVLASAKKMFESGVPYKKAGVVVSLLQPESVQQADLFSVATDTVSTESVMTAVDDLNNRFGKNTIQLASGLGTHGRSARDHVSPHYTTHWGDIRTVRA